MKLSKEDKKILLNWGHQEEDLEQIERAINKTKYISLENGKEIKKSAQEARNILGIEKFLSGISRSAFHYTTMRDNIFFDSSKLFE